MNDLDRILELELRRLLDPVVAVQPPPRGNRRDVRRRPILVVKSAGIELVANAIPAVEPVPVAVAAAPTAQL